MFITVTKYKDPKVIKQQQENNNQKEMGCGVSMCETATNSPHEISQLATRTLRSLVTSLKPDPSIISNHIFGQFLFKIQFNIHAFLLNNKTSLIPQDHPNQNIKNKWKIILYGSDTNLPNYTKCIGFQTQGDNQQKYLKNTSESNKLEEKKKENSNEQVQQQKGLQMQLLNHPCFQQIDKDLDRTFQMSIAKREQFSQVLKKIANHFPSMGYTQGINFIIGYFLIVGFSSSDSFWMFVHLTLNRKYMLLGLFQQKFPLSQVYTQIFKNILKRTHSPLYHHLYEALSLDDSIWIFKWFMTCFLYSFPIQICQYVMDVVIIIGGIGLVYFALAIVNVLEPYLLEIKDQCEISMFFNELKDIDCFNKYINLGEVMKFVYKFQLVEEDLSGSQFSEQDQNIYGKYLNAFYKQSFKGQKVQKRNQQNCLILISTQKNDKYENQECIKLLDKWYNGLIHEREQFVKSNGYNLIKGNKIRITIPVPNVKKIIKDKIPSLDMKTLNKIDQKQHIEEYSPTLKPSQQKEKNKSKISHLRHAVSLEGKSNNQQQLTHDTISMNTVSGLRNGRRLMKKNKLTQQIGELWDEEENNSSKSSQSQKFQINVQKIEINQQPVQNQIDKQLDVMNNRRKRRGSKSIATNDTKPQNHVKLKTEEIQYRKIKSKLLVHNQDDTLSMNIDLQHKISNKSNNNQAATNTSNINNQPSSSNINMLLMAGKSIMSSLSVSNVSASNKSSASSKQGIHYKKQKENGTVIKTRYCNCASKHKVDQSKISNMRFSQNGEESQEMSRIIGDSRTKQEIDRNSQGEKFQKREQQNNSVLKNQRQRKRQVTTQEWMMNSHGPNHPNTSKHQQSMVSDVQILDGGQLFKKKNKVSNKINGGTIVGNLGNNFFIQQQVVNHVQIVGRTNMSRLYHQQESCQSIFLPNNSQGHTSRLSAKAGNTNQFEIESVK